MLRKGLQEGNSMSEGISRTDEQHNCCSIPGGLRGESSNGERQTPQHGAVHEGGLDNAPQGAT